MKPYHESKKKMELIRLANAHAYALTTHTLISLSNINYAWCISLSQVLGKFTPFFHSYVVLDLLKSHSAPYICSCIS